METCFPLVCREQERRHPHGPIEVYPPAYSFVEAVPCGAAAANGQRDCGFRRRRPPVPTKATTRRSEATGGGSCWVQVVVLGPLFLSFLAVYRTSSPWLW